MAEFVDGNTKTFTASAAVAKHARVVLDATSGKVDAAVITDREIGTALTEAFADGDRISIKLRSASGTHKMIALAAIARNATCFTAAAGKVSTTAVTAFEVGIALDASAADGDIIEVLYRGDTAV